MAYNQLTRWERGYNSSIGNTGSILLGINDLFNGKGSFVGGSEGLVGVAVAPNGDIFCSDAKKHVIIRTTPSGTVSTYAGLSGVSGNNGDNVVDCYDARFSAPGGVACDRSGNLYIADVENNQIRKIDSRGRVSLVAGSASGSSGFVDGDGTSARFNNPYDVAVDQSGNVWVADTKNHSVRIIYKGSSVKTVAGDGTPGDVIGRGTIARFNKPYGVAASPSGWVFVTDSGNHKIKMIDQSWFVHHYSGSGMQGWHIGTAFDSSYQTLKYCDVDPTGNLYVIDFDEPPSVKSRLLMIDLNGSPNTVKYWAGPVQYVIGVAVNRSGVLYVVESVETEFESSSSSSSQSSQNSSSSSISSSLSTIAMSSSTSSSSSTEVMTSSSTKVQTSSSSSSTKARTSSSSSSQSSEMMTSSSSSTSSTSSLSSGFWLTIHQDEEVTAPLDGHVNARYVGPNDTSGWIDINGVLFNIADIGGAFVWDADNAHGGKYTFSFIGEMIYREANGYTFVITWDGPGSQLFFIDFHESSSSSSSKSSQSSKSSNLGSPSSDSSVSSESFKSSSSSPGNNLLLEDESVLATEGGEPILIE